MLRWSVTQQFLIDCFFFQLLKEKWHEQKTLQLSAYVDSLTILRSEKSVTRPIVVSLEFLKQRGLQGDFQSFVYFQYQAYELYEYNNFKIMMMSQNQDSFILQDGTIGFVLTCHQEIQRLFLIQDHFKNSNSYQMESYQYSFANNEYEVPMNMSSNSDENMSGNDLLSLTNQNSQKIKKKVDRSTKRALRPKNLSFSVKYRRYCIAMIRYTAVCEPVFGLSRRFCRSKKSQSKRCSELEAISKAMVLHPTSAKNNRDAVKRFDQELYNIFNTEFSIERDAPKAMDKTQSALLNLIQSKDDDRDSRDALDLFIRQYNQHRHEAIFLDIFIRCEKKNSISQKFL